MRTSGTTQPGLPPPFSPKVTAHWDAQFTGGRLYSDENFTLYLAPMLPGAEQVQLLETTDGHTRVVISPEIAAIARIEAQTPVSVASLRKRLEGESITFHGADYVYYCSPAMQTLLQAETPVSHIRRLTQADETVFSAFQAAASAADLDDAYVELDHWAVFGAFEEDLLVCAASIYPWKSTFIADLGVLTLPPFRGKGHAGKLVRSVCRYAIGKGYEPQYRCQTGNMPSVRLAQAAGLTLFGKWDVLTEND